MSIPNFDDPNKLKLLKLLSQQYPNIRSAGSEIINLTAISSLPKGTEHFMSDLHGEQEAFNHIINNCSGVIKEKIDACFAKTVTAKERQTLATLIYYPKEKLVEIKKTEEDLTDWYKVTINHLIELFRVIASKYSRSRVRKTLPKTYAWVFDELLHADSQNINRDNYHSLIIDTVISLDRQDNFIHTIADAIKNLAVDRLHIVGDIYDRGPHPDDILDLLMQHKACDIQWGNHDIVWMGAQSGSQACMANVLNLSLSYNNVEVLESGYGISLRPLDRFAKETYIDVEQFLPKAVSLSENKIDMARMRKAIAVIMFKLEGQVIMRNPNFDMQDRLLLNNIDFDNGTIVIEGKTHKLLDNNFPTIDKENPYELSEGEKEVMARLTHSFVHSDRLRVHARFLFEKGSLYHIYNENMLFHGAIPMNEDYTFSKFLCHNGTTLSGKAYMDYCDKMARLAFYGKRNSEEQTLGQDFCWYLWCGKTSPLFGRSRMTTFERLLIADKSTHTEVKNPYYALSTERKVFDIIAEEFHLSLEKSHIINGHVPVKSIDGESPLKAGGKIIVIDGGFCKAYHKQTGIAGYTLIYNSWGLRLSAHTPFTSKQDAVMYNEDIHSTVDLFEQTKDRINISETDIGKKLQEDIHDLSSLLGAYRTGLLKENN